MEPGPLTPPVEHPGLKPPGVIAPEHSIERGTRKPLGFWDRVKFLVLFAVIFSLVLKTKVDELPIDTFGDALRDTVSTLDWLLVLSGVEVMRQLHYVLSEHWAGWHGFWSNRFFGGWNRFVERFKPWTRYRVGRMFKWAMFLVVFAVFFSKVWDVGLIDAVATAPTRISDFLFATDTQPPLIFQMLLIMFIAVGQFVLIFWFLSRGGTEVYFPDDIETRFTDVWGQDPVLARVKENVLYLEDPKAVEDKGGYVPGGILLWGPPGTGKGEPISALLMTPSGPCRMGDLLPGDFVIGSDGRPTQILEVHLLGERDLYRVSFSDGSSVRVTEDHLWQVHSRYGGTKVRSVKELIGHLTEADGHDRYRIPMVQPVEFEELELPLHPYLLGALLGDGTFRSHVGISSADSAIIERVGDLLPDGDSLVPKAGVDYSVIGGTTRTIVKELDLFGRYSYEKFVPYRYLWNSAANRLDLLRGLMDTDGSIDTRGVIEYHTTSPSLARAVRFLVESFGGTCSDSTRTSRYTHDGEVRRGRPVTVVRMSLPDGLVPFTLDRKVSRVRATRRVAPQRRMLSIEPDGREQARCIRVAAADHLYVTERFIVTHNTLMAEAVAGETGRPFVFVDPGAFINMFMGVGILKVKSLFRKLRKLALRYGGVIVFFDEADSLGNRGAGVGGTGGYKTGNDPASVFANAPACRGASWLDPQALSVLQSEAMAAHPNQGEQPRPGLVNRIIMGMGMGGGGMGTLQALLTEISGLKKPRGFFNRSVRRALNMRPKPPPKYRILVMMATNMPDVLDPALLRPGRIDRQYRVGYPSKDGRKRTYRGYFDKISNVISDEQLEKLAVMTPYATGASIKDLVNESLIVAIRNGRQTVTWPDVLAAKTLKALGPPEDVDYIERERHATALHEACHAIAGYRLRPNLAIDLATIEKGQTYLGMVSSVPIEEEFTDWGRDFDANIMVSLASLAGERMFFNGDNSSGVTGDLINATTLALRMESVWAMGETIGSHIVTKAPAVAQPIADGTDRNVLDTKVGEQVERRLQNLLERVRRLLEENRHHVLAITHALETTKTLSGEDVEAIIEGAEGPGIDGRMYHDPEFREELERYHQAAVEAHDRHGKVAIPLPRRHGLVPIAVSSVLAAPKPNGSATNGEGGQALPLPPPPPQAPGAPPEWPEAPPTE